jgi:hypothetical protein
MNRLEGRLSKIEGSLPLPAPVMRNTVVTYAPGDAGFDAAFAELVAKGEVKEHDEVCRISVISRTGRDGLTMYRTVHDPEQTRVIASLPRTATGAVDLPRVPTADLETLAQILRDAEAEAPGSMARRLSSGGRLPDLPLGDETRGVS